MRTRGSGVDSWFRCGHVHSMEFSNADGIAHVLSGAGGDTDGVGCKMGACHVHTNKGVATVSVRMWLYVHVRVCIWARCHKRRICKGGD